MTVVEWVTSTLGVPVNAYGADPYAIGKRGPDGRYQVGVVYGPFNGHNVHAHIATDGSKKWATPDFVQAMFSVPFEDMGAKRITATTDSSNEPAKRFLERLGFQLHGFLPGSSNTGGDLLIYQIGRNEWRGLR